MSFRQATRLICLGSLLAYSSISLPAQTEISWYAWQPQVFSRAQQQSCLVLLDLTAKWCQFCKKMDRVTYRDKTVTNIIKRDYLAIRADEADYPELVRRYKNDGLPLTVVFDSQGKEIIKRSGYMKPQWMAWMLTAVAQDHVNNLNNRSQ